MRNLLYLFPVLVLLFSCEKENLIDSQPEPQPNNMIVVGVNTHNLESVDHYKVLEQIPGRPAVLNYDLDLDGNGSKDLRFINFRDTFGNTFPAKVRIEGLDSQTRLAVEQIGQPMFRRLDTVVFYSNSKNKVISRLRDHRACRPGVEGNWQNFTERVNSPLYRTLGDTISANDLIWADQLSLRSERFFGISQMRNSPDTLYQLEYSGEFLCNPLPDQFLFLGVQIAFKIQSSPDHSRLGYVDIVLTKSGPSNSPLYKLRVQNYFLQPES